MKIPLAEKLSRLGSWFERRNERPLIGFTLGSYYPLRRYPQGSQNLTGIVQPQDVVVSEFLGDTDRLYEMHEEAGGDLLFSAAPFFGVPWVEAALGCGVMADHGTGSMRSLPPPGFAEKPEIPEFSETNPWVAKMVEFIPALSERSGGRYPIGVTLMRGVTDLLSAVYGGEQFVYRMIDEPAEVRRVVGELTEFWIAFGRCLLDRLPLFHGGTGSFLYGMWSPGKHIWMQEDAAALLSPAMYEEFILAADRRLAGAFERAIVHLHPTRFIPTRYLLDTRLSAIELHIDHDGPRAEALLGHYLAISERKPLFIWGDVTPADLEFILARVPHRGLAISIIVESPEQARTYWELARSATAGVGRLP
ncbi:MAG: hypothetical protein KIT09_14100 [Bryobacteraceae bacterium]|nr:hypothetical protein [Bryobacteraceae bacterium]